jgi:hypothetical protein
MLTHGWRRFTWQNLVYDKNEINTFPIEKGIKISGTTKLPKPPHSGTPAFTTLTFYGDQITQIPIQKSNAEGKFSFGPFVFYDSIQTIIQSRLPRLKTKKAREVSIIMDEPAAPPIVVRNKDINNDGQNSDVLNVTKYASTINYQYNQTSQKLDEVVVIGNKKSERKAEMEDKSRLDDPSYRLDIASDESLSKQTVISLFARFPGVSYVGDNKFSIRGSIGKPPIFLDDIPVLLEEIADLPANQISFIDLYRGANAAVFANSPNIVFVIYSRRESTAASKVAKRKPGIVNFYTRGFYTAKEFYSPTYSGFPNQNPEPDLRTTLHWEPKITITKQNQTQSI